jgi:hypothetical protein
MEAYCVKCKAKKEMKSPKAVTMKNGKPATQGVCPTCKTKMFRIKGVGDWCFPAPFLHIELILLLK